MIPVHIIGGGPGGLGCALFLAQKSIPSTIYEKQSYPIDKACGEGVMPHGVKMLKNLNVWDGIPDTDKHPFCGIQYIFEGKPSIPANFKAGMGFGIRRLALSTALHRAAAKHPLIQIKQTDIRSKAQLDGLKGLIIGADGMRSSMRRLANIPIIQSAHRRYGTRLHYDSQPWSKYVQIYWANGFEAYVTPAGSHQVGIAFLWNKQRIPKDLDPTPANFLALLPELQRKLKGCKILSETRSTGPFYQIVPKPYRDSICLIGDASGYLDPLTGEGISLGLVQAKALADMLSSSTVDFKRLYQELDAQFFWHRNLTKILVKLSRHPRLLGSLIHVPWVGRKSFEWLFTN